MRKYKRLQFINYPTFHSSKIAQQFDGRVGAKYKGIKLAIWQEYATAISHVLISFG